MKAYKKWIWGLLGAIALGMISGCVVGPDDDHYRGGYNGEYGHGYGYEHHDYDHDRYNHDWH
ncbi:MAG TPA: hypothetical protein VG754_12220 [Verrucomicrobiae bacterium]|jgi:hypothetical protein|nr:hypothetical protein [Verrucomicrobiae bacterium]